FELWIGDLTVAGEDLPGFGYRRLLRNHPGVQRTTYVPQAVHRVKGAHPSAGHANQADHLTLELVESHQVESIFQNSAEAAVILGRAQDHSVGLLNILTQAEHILPIT